MYLAAACDTKSSEQRIFSLSSWSSQNLLNHRGCSGLAEEVQLACILLEHTRKSKSFYCSFSLVVRWRLDRDMRGPCCCVVSIYVQKALPLGVGRAQAQEDIEQCRVWPVHFSQQVTLGYPMCG